MVKNQNCFIWLDNFFVCIKTDVICKEIAKDVETKFDTSNF